MPSYGFWISLLNSVLDDSPKECILPQSVKKGPADMRFMEQHYRNSGEGPIQVRPWFAIWIMEAEWLYAWDCVLSQLQISVIIH